jgi:hypothetical protein
MLIESNPVTILCKASTVVYSPLTAVSTGTSTSATPTASTTAECFSVVESWKKMGKTTSVSSTSATACCYFLGSTTQTSGIPGVYCTSDGIVTEIKWYAQSLQGQIPPELSNLVNLTRL